MVLQTSNPGPSSVELNKPEFAIFAKLLPLLSNFNANKSQKQAGVVVELVPHFAPSNGNDGVIVNVDILPGQTLVCNKFRYCCTASPIAQAHPS